MGDFIQPNSPDGDKLFGYKLEGKYFPFIITSGGIFLCYCLSSVSQEYLYNKGFDYTSFLTLCAKVFAVIWGAAAGGLRGRKAPHSQHFIIGTLSFATMYLSNQSLVTLNYPTQTLFKSAKLIPVMIAALIINKKKFHILEYVGAACLLSGLFSFTLTDIKVTPNFDPAGVFLVSSALVCDALIGNLQEKQYNQYGSSANEMMTYSNVWASLLSIVGCMFDGSESTMEAIDFLQRDHMACLCIFLYCFLNILGIYFVLVMITMFGATLTAFTTSLRKALSVILSFVVYPKAFAWGYVFGGLVTALGIAANMRASALKRAAASKSLNGGMSGGGSNSSVAGEKPSASLELRPLMMDRTISENASPGLPTSPMNHSMSSGSNNDTISVRIAANQVPSSALDTQRLLATLTRDQSAHSDAADRELEAQQETSSGASNTAQSITASIYHPALRKSPSSATVTQDRLP